MRSIARETRREIRWIVSSRLLLALIGGAVVMAAWGALAGASSAIALVVQFEGTLRLYKENGEDISTALAAPAGVSGDASQQNIGNPLRYDLDQAVQALTQTQGMGAVASTLSLSAFILLPVIGFVVAVYLATHDTASGSIAWRWPESGAVRLAGSKAIALAVTMVALTAATAVASVVGSWITGPIVAARAAELASFAVPGPDVGRTVLIGVLAASAGTTAALLGLLVGTVTRDRTFTVAVFVLAYFLAPMLGASDPRNMIPLTGEGVFYFVGQFRPEAVGDLQPVVGAAAQGVAALIAIIGVAVTWRVRSRLPSER